MSAPLPTDLDIANAATLRPIADVAADLGVRDEHLEPYGRGVAKIDLAVLDEPAPTHTARYVVVTAVTPTPLGEGKTTTSVGLAQALHRLGQRAVVALRQPSMGPTFGIKGGAAGGGYSQVVPMERLNLHLTGDFHAVTSAHNLLAAMIDNHLHHGNELGIDVRNITWRRVLDVNDRALRNVVIGLGARQDGLARETGFDITAASEVMVLLTLATSLHDLRERLGRIVVGYTNEGKSVTAEDLHAAGAMTAILEDALKPNLLQTLEGGPAIIHCGPFGNIATGTSSVTADLIAMRGSDYAITEAGFGADMGAERFFDVKCRVSGLKPDVAVVVATVRALKTHSGRYAVRAGKPLPAGMLKESPKDVEAGLPNLRKHIEIVRRFGVQPVVAINAFPDDHDSEHAVIRRFCNSLGVRSAVTRHVAEGGAGRAGARPGRRRGRARADRLRVPLPPRPAARAEDRGHRHPGLRRRRHRREPRGSASTQGLRTAGLRRPARRHRQDAPVHLVGPHPARCPARVADAGARGARGGGRRLRLRDLR